MDEEAAPPRSQTDLIMKEPETTSLAEFLESVPPSQTRKILDLSRKKSTTKSDP